MALRLHRLIARFNYRRRYSPASHRVEVARHAWPNPTDAETEAFQAAYESARQADKARWNALPLPARKLAALTFRHELRLKRHAQPS